MSLKVKEHRVVNCRLPSTQPEEQQKIKVGEGGGEEDIAYHRDVAQLQPFILCAALLHVLCS